MTRRRDHENEHHDDTAAEADERPAVQLDVPASAKSSDGSLSDKVNALFSQADSLRSEAADRVYTLEQELEDAKGELEKIDRLLGRTPSQSASKSGRAPRDPSAPKGERAPRGHWLSKVTEVLKDKPDGLKKGELVEALGIASDARQVATVSSALQQGKKSGAIGQRDGKYFTA